MTPVLMAVCLAAGFGLGWLTKRHRLGLLAENNHWVGEEIEALKGADLDADVARERALRLSGDTPAVDDLIPGFMADSGYRPPGDPVVYKIEPDGLLGRVCAYSVHCAEPVGGKVTWDTGKVEWLCAEHYTAVMGDEPTHLGPCGWSDGDTVCGDPTAGTVTWPEGPVDLCATHMAWVRESEDAPVAPELRD